jgi:hypothetical protein
MYLAQRVCIERKTNSLRTMRRKIYSGEEWAKINKGKLYFMHPQTIFLFWKILV